MTASYGEGGGFGVFGGVAAVLGQGREERCKLPVEEQRRKHMETIHQIPLGPIQVPITAGAGVYQMNDLLMPKAGYMWSIRNLTAAGYTAGTVVAYKGGMVVGGSYVGLGLGQPFPFSAQGAATIGRGELLLDQGDSLVIVCGTQNPGGAAITLGTGFAGVQIVGAADCFERWYLPYYID